MSIAEGDTAFVTDLFADAGKITIRPTVGVCTDGRLFAALDRDGEPQLRAKGASARRRAAAGATHVPRTNPETGKLRRLGHWSLPGDALDDPALACDWAGHALAQCEEGS